MDTRRCQLGLSIDHSTMLNELLQWLRVSAWAWELNYCLDSCRTSFELLPFHSPPGSSPLLREKKSQPLIQKIWLLISGKYQPTGYGCQGLGTATQHEVITEFACVPTICWSHCDGSSSFQDYVLCHPCRDLLNSCLLRSVCQACSTSVASPLKLESDQSGKRDDVIGLSCYRLSKSSLERLP